MAKEYNQNEAPAPITPWEEELPRLVMEEWDKGRQYVSDIDDLCEDIYKMLRGQRPEKNYDWQSNVVINKVFQVVWTAVPYITQKVFGADPIIGVDSFGDKKGAWQREQLLQFWHTMQPGNERHTPFFLTFVLWTLRSLLNGVGVVKKSWHQRTKVKSIETTIALPVGVGEGDTIETRQETVTKRTTVPIEDWPVTTVVNNRDFVCDWALSPGESIRKGRFITHRIVKDLQSLYSSKINYINLDEVERKASSTTKYDEDHADAKSLDGQEDPPKSDFYVDVELYERQGLLLVYKDSGDPCFEMEDIGSDKVTEREMIVTVARIKGKDTLIRYEKNNAEEKTYIDMHIYLDPERWNSMGQVEPFMDIQTALNDNINAMFDEIWQNLMPPVVVNKFALWDWDTMIYAPGQRWMGGGNPNENIMFKTPSNITSDAWQKHMLLNNEIDLTSAVTPPMQGAGKEKAATTNVLNAQMSAGKLDFLIKMIEVTALVPSAQMDVRLAKKFAHPLSLASILGEPFTFSDWEEVYKFKPAASSVKLEHQKNQEVQADTQLIQIFSAFQNPNAPKIVNELYANILRNRGMPKEAAMLDEDFYEPSSDAGNIQMLDKLTGKMSNQNEVPISGPEADVRKLTYQGAQ